MRVHDLLYLEKWNFLFCSLNPITRNSKNLYKSIKITKINSKEERKNETTNLRDRNDDTPRPWISKQRGKERKLKQRTARRRVSRHRSSGPTARRLFSYRLTYLYIRTMFHFYRPMRAASYHTSCRVGTQRIASIAARNTVPICISLFHMLTGTIVLSHKYISPHKYVPPTTNIPSNFTTSLSVSLTSKERTPD